MAGLLAGLYELASIGFFFVLVLGSTWLAGLASDIFTAMGRKS